MNRFYDQIADEYDSLVQEDVQANRFPYAAYNHLQDIIADYIAGNKHLSKVKVLDIGIGTGSLYEKIMPEKIDITGIDNSKTMLEIAHMRLPEARLISFDIQKGIPQALKQENFDYIVINYLFKHFDHPMITATINQLVKLLAPFGKIFIGDILFFDESVRQLYLNDHPDDLYPGYYYHAYMDIIQSIDDDLALSFMEVNEYTGIMIVEKYYENPLHFEETLIKYKTNTVKWKSKQTQKHRE